MNNEKTPISQEAIKKLEKYRWLIYGILVLCYFFVVFHRMSTGVMREELGASFGIGPAEFAILGSCYFYTYTLMQIPAGILADTLGAKKTIAGGMLVAALGSAIFAFAPSIGLAYIGRAIVGAGVAVVFIPILVIQSQWFYTKDFAMLTGATTATGNLGGLAAQTPLLFLLGMMGWRNSFLVVSGISVALFFLVLVFVKSSPKEMGLPTIAQIEGRTVAAKGAKKNIFKALKGIFLNPLTWLPVVITSGTMGAYITFSSTWGVSLIMSKFGLDKMAAANGNLVQLLAVAMGGAVIGGLSDKLRNRKMVTIVLTAMYAISWFVMIYVDVPAALYYPLLIVMGWGSCAFITAITLVKEYNNPENAAKSTAFANTLSFSAGAIFPVIIGKGMKAVVDSGKVADFTDYAAVFSWLPWAVFATFVAALFLKETGAVSIYKERK